MRRRGFPEKVDMPLKIRASVAELTHTLDAEIPRLMAESHVAGVSIALIRDHQIVLTAGFGVKNTEIGNLVTPQTVFEAYSLTKPLVAYRALKLCEQGALDLDVPLNDYLSEPYVENDARIEHITLRMALSHTSGLQDDESERSIAFPPGEKWSYSTVGYYYVQHVIDRMSREPFDRNMQKHLVSPLGMESSSFVWQDRFGPVMAQGHDLQGVPEDDRQISVADADSLLTTSSDYARFVAECIRRSQGNDHHLGSQSALEMLKRQVRVHNRLHWGLGWGLEDTEDGPFVWHVGGGKGAPFQNFVLASTLHGVGVVIMTNSANGGSVFEPIVALTTGGAFSLFPFVRTYFF